MNMAYVTSYAYYSAPLHQSFTEPQPMCAPRAVELVEDLQQVYLQCKRISRRYGMTLDVSTDVVCGETHYVNAEDRKESIRIK